MKNKIVLLFLLILSLSFFICSVKAVPDTLYLDAPNVYNAYTTGIWDGNGLGWSFAGNNEYLSKCVWYIEDNDGTPNSGYLMCGLYIGAGGNSSTQWNSNTVTFDNITGSDYAMITFEFEHVTLLATGTTYTIGLINNGSGSGFYKVGHPDDGAYYTKTNWGSSWSYQAGSGLFAHKLYTNSVPLWLEPTPTPPPTPTPSPTPIPTDTPLPTDTATPQNINANFDIGFWVVVILLFALNTVFIIKRIPIVQTVLTIMTFFIGAIQLFAIYSVITIILMIYSVIALIVNVMSEG